MTYSVGGKEAYRVVVVGGGSAGWIAAARIAAASPGPDVQVTLVESPNTPIVGVGEGTWPTMRNTLAKIGVKEADFIRSTDAAFKQGARFVGWADGSQQDAYYHPLNAPIGAGEVDMAAFWAAGGANGQPFAAAVDFQAALCDAGLAPKLITTRQYSGAANYAYHLDAGKFATFLREHSVGVLGVQHLREDVVEVEQAENGDILRLKCASGAVISGDLFIDCSGFKGLLIGGVYGVTLRDRRDILFADRALAMQVPYERPDSPITCHTVATAQTAGWIWDIGLWSRRGVGYVYSSAHVDDDAAEETLRAYIGPQAKDLSARRLEINAGQRRSFWQNNCVAVGLSAGFLEPLEASSLVLVEVAVDTIASRLPRTRDAMAVAARQFNAAFSHHWERVVEFLKLHYALSRRTDTAFWRDNVDPRSFPDGLSERLELWRAHTPAMQDFAHG
jgi:tryptophan halogenase